METKAAGQTEIEERELEADKKNCRRFGPCGVGQKALLSEQLLL